MLDEIMDVPVPSLFSFQATYDATGAQFEIANADSRKAPSQEFHH
jgi:hypothetical protein